MTKTKAPKKFEIAHSGSYWQDLRRRRALREGAQPCFVEPLVLEPDRITVVPTPRNQPKPIRGPPARYSYTSSSGRTYTMPTPDEALAASDAVLLARLKAGPEASCKRKLGEMVRKQCAAAKASASKELGSSRGSSS
ncbi:hypothetical protein C8J57DRAFT_1224871 [Mycena rebaudengoi]|nr:hypothetical protein C8J57DRAFT_1506099 [Mycena rebaudengoi]KAJ7273986.1 hypothetical protein C8J57DRAFT_1224871 [Mycena rebaudengoi]